MNAGDAIYSALSAASAVTALVSTRIYPIDAPLDVDLPCVWYDVTLAAAVDGSANMAPAQVQVGCLAHTEASMHSLADAVDAALNGLTRYASGTWLRSLTVMGRTESRDPEQNLWGTVLAYSASVTF
jgi:hypothetical protein